MCYMTAAATSVWMTGRSRPWFAGKLCQKYLLLHRLRTSRMVVELSRLLGCSLLGQLGRMVLSLCRELFLQHRFLISELLNLEAPQGQSEKLPVLWTSYMSGLLSGSTSVNTKLAVQGVNQAFTQSTYLTNK